MSEFEELYHLYYKDVYYFVLKLADYRDDIAEEVTQESFYQAFISISRFRGECSIKSWLCQIAKNTYYKDLKTHAKEEAVCELFGGDKQNIKVIGIRHGEKMYETLLTNEECANAVDLGAFYRVPSDNRNLNYDKYFKVGDTRRNTLTEFNSSNTDLLNVAQVQEKLLSLSYIREELAAWNKK